MEPRSAIWNLAQQPLEEETMKDRTAINRRRALQGIAAAAAFAFAGSALAADPFKIGLILPLTGPFASSGYGRNASARDAGRKGALA